MEQTPGNKHPATIPSPGTKPDLSEACPKGLLLTLVWFLVGRFTFFRHFLSFFSINHFATCCRNLCNLNINYPCSAFNYLKQKRLARVFWYFCLQLIMSQPFHGYTVTRVEEKEQNSESFWNFDRFNGKAHVDFYWKSIIQNLQD